MRSHSLGEIPRRSARRFPDKVAVVDGDVSLTFAEFDELVDRAAAALRDNGFTPGDRIALLAHNCWQYAVLAFATARAGVVLVPINFMLTADEISFILGHSRVRGFIVERDLIPTAAQAMANSADVTTRVAITPDGLHAPPSWDDFAWWLTTTTPAPELEVADDQLVRLMYTSGTESRPKGVMHSSRSLVSNYVSTIVAGSMSVDDIEIHSMPLYHCAQLDNFLATDIYLGATSIILPRPEPDAILRGIATHRATNYFAPPTIWIDLLRSPTFDEVDLSSLRKGYYGASAMPTEILHEIRERLPNLQLWNFYGQTEMAPLASALGPAEQGEHAGAAGRPAHQRRDHDSRRHRHTGPARDRRRDRTPRPAPDAGLPRRPSPDGGGLPRRMVSLRRPRLLRRLRVVARRRSQEGHDQDRRRECRKQGSRRGSVPAPCSAGGGCIRDPPSAMGRGRGGRCGRSRRRARQPR